MILFLQEVVEEAHSAGHGKVLKGQGLSMEELQDWQTILQPGDSHHLRHWETRQGFTYQDWDETREGREEIIFPQFCCSGTGFHKKKQKKNILFNFMICFLFKVFDLILD